MTYTPQIVGAVIVVALAGAVSGASIGDSPVLMRAHSDNLPEAPIVSAGYTGTPNGKRPPDHYPLKTPEGTIEVEELALHGRLRDRGGDLWWRGRGDEAIRMTAEYDFYEQASPERIEHERRLLAYHEGGRPEAPAAVAREANAQGAMTRAEAPMALAEPREVEGSEVEPEPVYSVGNSKTIDVSAALANDSGQ